MYLIGLRFEEFAGWRAPCFSRSEYDWWANEHVRFAGAYDLHSVIEAQRVVARGIPRVFAMGVFGVVIYFVGIGQWLAAEACRRH